MKAKILILIVFTFVVISVKAQVQNYMLGVDEYIDYANIKRTNSPGSQPYDNIKGSPYLFEDFITGKIKLKDGKTYEGPLRYDIYANKIEFKSSAGEVFSVINPETIDKIFMNESRLIFIPDNKNVQEGNYYEVLIEGEFSLLVKHTTILKDPVPAKPYYAAKPAMFVTKENNFYLLSENSGLVEIKNKEDLAGIDTNRGDEISKYIKENKMKLSNRSDLIELTNFLNAGN